MSRSRWAVVPAKSLHRGKSRLAAALSEAERTALNRRLLERTLAVVLGIEQLEAVVVVSPDAQALRLAEDAGAIALDERAENGPAPGLNPALIFARDWARERGADEVMTVFADLPWLAREDLLAVLGCTIGSPGVAIAPDRAEQGTNVLRLSPPGAIDYAYGPGSFERHRARAITAGAEPVIIRRPGLQFDIDSPQDLERWKGSASEPDRPASTFST